MEKTCRISGKPFEITEEDKEFYQRFAVPEPTLCPEERARARMAFANQRHLFARECAGSGKRILTNFPPEADVPVFDIGYWYGDSWDQLATGRDYDFSRPFFEQFAELLKVAPRPNLQRAPQFDENSDYTNYAGKNKNCYLIFDSDKNEDCLYSYSINECRDAVDCFRVEASELVYECIDCTGCYGSVALQDCDNCSESAFLKNCIGCSECFASVNLRNKRFCYFNQQLSESEYREAVAKHQPFRYQALQKLRSQFSEYVSQFPQRYMQGVQNENVTGDHLTFSKNAHECFDSRKLWDCRYVQQAFDDAANCMDCTECGDGAELLYESCYCGYQVQNLRFVSHALGGASNQTYCYFCPTSNDIFGCVGVHHAEYRILNKQYSKDEFTTLVSKIIEQMSDAGEWGEFFPAELSPFPYNLSHAQEYLPLTKDQALERGYYWREAPRLDEEASGFEPSEYIADVSDDIISEVLLCPESSRKFKIQKAELGFYRKMNLPIPLIAPDERMLRRLRLRNPRVLYNRTCDRSGIELMSTISPDRPEEVLSEEEFQKAVE